MDQDNLLISDIMEASFSSVYWSLDMSDQAASITHESEKINY